jgi:hypothetical protein
MPFLAFTLLWLLNWRTEGCSPQRLIVERDAVDLTAAVRRPGRSMRSSPPGGDHCHGTRERRTIPRSGRKGQASRTSGAPWRETRFDP